MQSESIRINNNNQYRNQLIIYSIDVNVKSHSFFEFIHALINNFYLEFKIE